MISSNIQTFKVGINKRTLIVGNRFMSNTLPTNSTISLSLTHTHTHKHTHTNTHTHSSTQRTLSLSSWNTHTHTHTHTQQLSKKNLFMISRPKKSCILKYLIEHSYHHQQQKTLTSKVDFPNKNPV